MKVTRGEVGGITRGRVFRNYYKGHIDKNQGGGWKQGREVGLAGVGWGVVGRKCSQLYLNNNKVIKKKIFAFVPLKSCCPGHHCVEGEMGSRPPRLRPIHLQTPWHPHIPSERWVSVSLITPHENMRSSIDGEFKLIHRKGYGI